MTSQNPVIPSGFRLSDKRGPFTTHNGPTYHRHVDGGLEHGLLVLDRHCNALGILHGGMATAFMDGVLAGGVFRATGRRSVTLRLTVDFLDAAKVGDWLEARVLETGHDDQICRAHGEISRNGAPILRARGIFRLSQR